jgi:ribonucleoside-triphosphate reductase
MFLLLLVLNWLDQIYPPEVKNALLAAICICMICNKFPAYCFVLGYQRSSYSRFLKSGCKIESRPAKHFRPALGQVVNFFYTMQGGKLQEHRL